MTNEILKILITALGIIVTGLCTWLVGVATAFINSKIKDKKIARITSQLTMLILNAVQEVFQTYVDTLKKENKFDKEAQTLAKNKAFNIINSQITPDIKEFISENYGDVKEYLLNRIESTIYSLKNSK